MKRICAAVSVLFLVAGCSSAGMNNPPTGQDETTAKSGELSDPFFAYDRPQNYETVTDHVSVPVRDGAKIACDLLRPDAEGEFPGIVYEYTAYADNAGDFAEDAEYFAQRGYSALICQARGSGDSPGELDPFGPQEQEDNYDVIEWLASQEHSTGRIGQMGVSYGGHTSLLAAVNKPPHLEAIIPINGMSDWYENTIYRGGIYSPRIGDWQREVAPLTVDAYAEHPLYSDYWEDRSVASRWEDLDVPVLEINGWYDRYRDGMAKNHIARPGSVWMVSGPWEHGYPQDQEESFGMGAYLAWWDHWLANDDAPLPQSKIVSYELPGGGDGAGWREFNEWPANEVEPVSLWFDNEGLTDAPADADDAGDRTFAVNTSEEPATDDQRILAQTSPLDEDLVIAGNIVADLTVSFTADDGTVAVVIEDVDPGGETTRVTEGWLKASHRDGHRKLAQVVPAKDYKLSVDVWPTHYRFRQGHQLRVQVSSDDYPEIESSAPDGDVTVRTGAHASSIKLPVLSD